VNADDPAAYGEAWAEVYDRFFPPDADADAAAEFVAQLAGGGPVLEFAIGTGRLALPLVERGIEVHGIDSSAAMVDKLHAKPAGAAVPVTIGDMSTTRIAGEFAVVLLGFNTMFVLPDQEAQIACFSNAAAHLLPGGAFVIEAFVPDLGRFDRGQRVGTRTIDPDRVVLDITQHDPVGQRLRAAIVFLEATGIRILPITARYAWPPELDLMARIAGLELAERWGGWRREPFDAASARHVSVYRR
jgi:methyltransferase family protein